MLLDLRLDLIFRNKRFDVPEGIHCAYDEIEEFYHHLPLNRAVIIPDAVSIHSKEVVEFLKANVYTPATNLVGGIYDWGRDGLPLIIDKGKTLIGGCMRQLRTQGKCK